MDALQAFRDRALNSENPVTRGTAQNPDIYFQGREASNKFYDAVSDMVADYMDKISAITGRKYRPFDSMELPMQKISSSLWDRLPRLSVR